MMVMGTVVVGVDSAGTTERGVHNKRIYLVSNVFL